MRVAPMTVPQTAADPRPINMVAARNQTQSNIPSPRPKAGGAAPPRRREATGQDLPPTRRAAGQRPCDAQIGRPKNDRCLGRLSKADAWASLPDWLKMDNPACAA